MIIADNTKMCYFVWLRFPNDIIDQVENTITGKDCTFTAFVVEAVRIALEDINDK